MLGQDRPAPKPGAGEAPCLWAPDSAPPGTLGINHDLDSLKARKFFLLSDPNLPCSQDFLTQSNSLVFKTFFLFKPRHTSSKTKPQSINMFMELLRGDRGGASIPYSQTRGCKSREHLGDSPQTPGWLSELYAPLWALSFVGSK